MRPLRTQIVRATRCARYNNPSFILARHLTSTHATYDSPQTSSKVSDHDHSAESYTKEVDSSPPADSSTYQVDASSDAVQRPHKPPSGKYSQAGVGSEEYRMVDKETPGKGSETSRSNEGPNEASAAGKPKGKK